MKCLLANERGTAVVELAILAPVLALLTVGIVDLSKGITRRLEVSDAVHSVLEKAAANNFNIKASETDTTYTFLKDEAADAANVDPSEVTVKVWLECDGEEQPQGTPSCDTDEVSATYVQLTIGTTFRPSFTSIVAPDANGTYPIWAEAAVRIQ